MQDTSTTLLLAPSLSRADWPVATWDQAAPGPRQSQVPGTTGHTRSQCSASVPVCPLLTPDIANQISSAGCW